MTKNFWVSAGLSLAIALAAPLSVQAQSSDASALTAEQLEELFKKQKTRGLVLAPSTPPTDTTTSTEALTTEAATSTYVPLPAAEQVNIQISFDFDSAALREDQKPKLATLCQVMNAVDVEVFNIVGHTDASGSASYNDRLSKLRAEEVKRHLVTNCGIAPERLNAEGVGERFPFDENNPRADENRRVEFQALS